jgi:signal transduction histidine kinase
MDSVAGQAALRASVITLCALLLTGVGTATVLYVEAVRSLDEMLLIAAQEGAHPPEWQAEHYRSPIEVHVVEGRGKSERPRFYDSGDIRGVELAVEAEGDEDDGDDRHLRVFAEAKRVELVETVAPFLVPFGAVGVGVAALAGLAQAVGMRRALRPLARAADDASRIVGLGGGARLVEDGPSEVRTMLVAVNALLGRLQAAFAGQARFTAEAAHELRTPVAGMRGALEVALRRPRSDQEYRAALTEALGASERLGALVDGLLALARVDAGQADEGRETEHAAVIAQRAASQEKAGLDAAGCTLSLEVRADPEVSVHAPLLIAAIANLLRNAARHAPGHPVALRVEERGEHVAFIVDDEGSGVAVAEREEVYARFARGAAARGEHREGLGLGLPLAREVAHRHGGECWIEESPAGGCRAIVTVRRSAKP